MKKRDESKGLSGWASLKRTLFYGALICFTLLLVGYVSICFSIRHSVKQISAQALQEYPGDRIEALMAYVESENHSLRQRNRAVWALGQIGDSRALLTLEKFRTGKPCDHSSQLCQREIGKAIEGCEGSFNATAWLPR
jgi:HEAT repeat protein